MDTPNPAQQTFERLYVTPLEIQERLGVSRADILRARSRGMLPDPVIVPGVRCFIWERKRVEKFLDAWEISLKSRRGELRQD